MTSASPLSSQTMASESQYDSISTTYASLYGASSNTAYPCALIEESNLKHIISPFLSDGIPKRILDLACGNGYYSRLFLQWGAASVVGVDISQSMIDEARRIQSESSNTAEQHELTFLLGDATSPELAAKLSEHGSPFDIVTGTWLLNYAPSLEVMTQMFTTISSNLKPGGVFIGLTIPPPLGSADELDRVHREDWPVYGETGHVIRTLPNDTGFEIHTKIGMPDTPQDQWVNFDNYNLRNWVFEEAAKKAGLEGLEWQPFLLTEEVRRAKPVGYWNRAVLSPHFRICVVRK